MSMLKVSCPHCGTPTRIDSARLPDQPLRLPCPACQGELVLDKARLLASQQPGEVASPPAPTPTPTPAPSAATTEPRAAAPASAPAAVTPALAPAPERPPATPPARAAAVAAQPVTPGHLPPSFSIPEGTRLPSGIMVGDDVSVMASLTESLATWGSSLEVLGGPEIVKQLEYVPELQIVVTSQAGSPPSSQLAPFVDLPSRTRRRTFIVLVAHDVTTFDGNQAFLHEVDLVVGRGDLDRAHEILFAAWEHRNRLSAPLLAEEEAVLAGAPGSGRSS